MSPARRLLVFEPGSRFHTVDVDGHARLWQVTPDGFLVIVALAPLVLPDPPEQPVEGVPRGK